MTVIITTTSFITYWKPIWLSLSSVVVLLIIWYTLKNNVEIDSNEIGDLVLQYAPFVISTLIMSIGISYMIAKTFDFDRISRERNTLILSHKKWGEWKQTKVVMDDVKTIKKCRMSVSGIKKAMVLQIVLDNDVYTSEVIKNVEIVSKELSRKLKLEFSSGELCEYRK